LKIFLGKVNVPEGGGITFAGLATNDAFGRDYPMSDEEVYESFDGYKRKSPLVFYWSGDFPIVIGPYLKITSTGMPGFSLPSGLLTSSSIA